MLDWRPRWTWPITITVVLPHLRTLIADFSMLLCAAALRICSLSLLLCSPPQNSQGLPQVERDLLQVEQLSQKLKARTARADAGQQTLAATRLLAQEGLDTRKCAHILHMRASTVPLCQHACQHCSTGWTLVIGLRSQELILSHRITCSFKSV